MKTISSMAQPPDHLAVFILETCPWMDESWELDNIGYVFALDDNDIGTTTINPLPEVQIDLATFDLWEEPAIHAPQTPLSAITSSHPVAPTRAPKP